MTMDWGALDRLILDAELSGHKIGVTIIAPNQATYRYRGDEDFLAASTIKIAVMVSIFQKVDQGELSLERCIVVRREDKVPGSGVLQGIHDDVALNMADLLYLMISISDNPSTNLLIDLVGIDEVNRTIRNLGLTRSTLVRKMEGRPARGMDNENLATPAELARLIQLIVAEEAASTDSCQRMMQLLTGQQNGRRIGRYVPRQKGVSWGSKTGTSRETVNDVGFIKTDVGFMILSIFAHQVPGIYEGEQLVGNIAREAMIATGIVEPLQIA